MCAQRVQLKTTIDGAQVPLNPYTDCVKNVRQQMPLAGSKLLGTTVLYVGPQTDKYSTGVCYTCKATQSNSYYWDTVAVPFNYDSESNQTHLYTPDGTCLSISNDHRGTLHLQNASGQDVLYVGEDCASVFGRGLVFENQIFSDLAIRSGFDRSSIGRLVLGEPTEQNTVEHYLQLPVQGTEQIIRKYCKVYTVDGNYAIESGLMMPFYTDNKYISVNGDDIFAEVSTSIGNGYGAKLQIYGSTYDQCTATFKVGSVNSGYFGFGIDQLHNAIITSEGLGRGIQLVDNLDEYDQETGCSKFIVRDMDMTNMLYIAGEYVTDDEQMTWDYKVTAKIYDRDIAFKEDVEAVAQRVAALQGNSGGGGGGGTTNITVNGVSPDADGNIALEAENITFNLKDGEGYAIPISGAISTENLQSFFTSIQYAIFSVNGHCAYVNSDNPEQVITDINIYGNTMYLETPENVTPMHDWDGNPLSQKTVYDLAYDVYTHSVKEISTDGGETYSTAENGKLNLTITCPVNGWVANEYGAEFGAYISVTDILDQLSRKSIRTINYNAVEDEDTGNINIYAGELLMRSSSYEGDYPPTVDDALYTTDTYKMGSPIYYSYAVQSCEPNTDYQTDSTGYILLELGIRDGEVPFDPFLVTINEITVAALMPAAGTRQAFMFPCPSWATWRCDSPGLPFEIVSIQFVQGEHIMY